MPSPFSRRPLPGLIVVALAGAALLAILVAPGDVRGQTPPAGPPAGQLSGDLPANGLGLVVWGGGSVDAVRAAASGRGCALISVWVIDRGAFIGHLVGAPDVVNRAFVARFPSGLPSTPAIFVCRGGTSPVPTITPLPPVTPVPSATPIPAPAPPSTSARQIEDSGCSLFPDDNPWATKITNAPRHPNSDRYLAYIAAAGGNQALHADFGENPDYGIPYVVVPADQPTTPVTFDYADESDAGPYPIPANVPIEAGSDAHALIVRKGECKLYELFALERSGAGWTAGSGAIFDLRSNALRPDGWTSADAAGLPIFAGLVRYDEVARGRIDHALRFTVSRTQRGYIHPATHFASAITNADAPPMGLRLRLRADFDRSRYTGQARVVLDALRDYGMIVADNGSNWFISGATDPRWNDNELNQLKTVPGSAFEVVDTGPVLR